MWLMSTTHQLCSQCNTNRCFRWQSACQRCFKLTEFSGGILDVCKTYCLWLAPLGLENMLQNGLGLGFVLLIVMLSQDIVHHRSTSFSIMVILKTLLLNCLHNTISVALIVHKALQNHSAFGGLYLVGQLLWYRYHCPLVGNDSQSGPGIGNICRFSNDVHNDAWRTTWMRDGPRTNAALVLDVL